MPRYPPLLSASQGAVQSVVRSHHAVVVLQQKLERQLPELGKSTAPAAAAAAAAEEDDEEDEDENDEDDDEDGEGTAREDDFGALQAQVCRTDDCTASKPCDEAHEVARPGMHCR